MIRLLFFLVLLYTAVAIVSGLGDFVDMWRKAKENVGADFGQSLIVKVPDFKAISDIPTRKRAFFSFIGPSIDKANQRIVAQRERLIALSEQDFADYSQSDREFIESLKTEYRVKATDHSVVIDTLMRRVDKVPRELVLMQAANESAWGTSRFARLGLNFFGQWCFSKGCGIVPVDRNEGASHEVAAYKSVQHAVNAYLRNINTHNAYTELRKTRIALREQGKKLDAKVLARGLTSYSERGEEYVEELIKMINYNQKLMAES